ncbi:MAG: hypothetical protein WBV22_09475 [Anaerolineaceae bacterium]
MMSKDHPGLIALIGSGETTRSGGQVFERFIKNYPSGSRIAVLETPAGFELNSPAVADRVADYLRNRLQNYEPTVEIIPARRRGTDLSPDNPLVIQPMAEASLLFMGPGSPSYAVRQLRGSLAWELMRAKFRQGTSLALASAAAVAFGKFSLPVYEIFKVGEDPHWLEGLDFLSPFGLETVIIPHWNNKEGGDELDTSHCFMGKSRFEELYGLLPESVTVVGIDELTTLVIDLTGERCDVMGSGQVHLIREGTENTFEPRTSFEISEMGDFRSIGKPDKWSANIEQMLVECEPDSGQVIIPPDVITLADERQRARDRTDWKAADRFREQIESLGWQITDTPEGPVLQLRNN